MSDTAFQTIVENALHPQFAIQVSTGSNQSKTGFNKNQFGLKGKSGNKGGKFASKHGVGKKKDTSHYICRLCNTKGHGP
jgi:hypothetical protein